MGRVILRSDGFYTRVYDGDTAKETKIKCDFGFFQHWIDALEIEGEVTLKNLVDIISEDEGVLTMIEMLTQCSIEPFFAELNQECEREGQELSHLLIDKSFEKRESYKDAPPELFDFVHCHGVYKEPVKDPNFPDVETFHCCLDFSSWAGLKDLPIKLQEIGELTDSINGYSKEEVSVFYHVEDLFSGIFGELCFHGSPNERDNRIEDLHKRIKHIEEHPEDLITWEEFEKRLEEKLKSKE